jgi:hypothetical protein
LAPQDYNQLLQHWDYDKSAPLDIKQAGMQERDGITIYDISFSSPVGHAKRGSRTERWRGYILLGGAPWKGAFSSGDLWALVHAGI